ncbi:MAG: hypothetical protein DI598_05700 [Pseudopedobacter saltans]|uniref:DUF1266 domain-containing protein n=1 Tax=Pseudopedobacter saltans TaxID=151895 RepID=A0A2W5GX03_9SPHI|nr:MAG: hypothetical protein DI598_05700 [Pseudopedobacter saltans]
MKTTKLALTAFLFAAISFCTLTSCNSDKKGKSGENSSTESAKNDDELKSFMLGGIYFENGYGGKSSTESAGSQSGTSPEDLIKGYREIFIFPYKPAEGACAKTMLSQYWDVNSKDSLMSVLDKLKTHKMESSHTKSWDYARLVNNACMGYAAGYLTKEEATKIIGDVLPLAKADYKTWDEYFADFAKGRNQWNAEETADKKAFDELSTSITKGDKSIYTVLPLN